MIELAAILAISSNNVIGVDGDIPWDCSEDLRRFRKITQFQTVIMGRITKESLLRKGVFPLKDRLNFVVTSDAAAWNDQDDMACSVPSVAEALRVAESVGIGKNAFIIGGARLYEENIGACSTIYLTRIHKHIKAGPSSIVTKVRPDLINYQDFETENLGTAKGGLATFFKLTRRQIK